MSRKSGNRFSDEDMRKPKNAERRRPRQGIARSDRRAAGAHIDVTLIEAA
jgi:hypothetical protein